MADKIKAPWTESQVMALFLWQNDPLAHPFTCATESCPNDLIATTSGWVCSSCNYTQDWCWDFMTAAAGPSEFLEKHKNIKDLSSTIKFPDDD